MSEQSTTRRISHLNLALADAERRESQREYRNLWPRLGKPNRHAHHWKSKRGRHA